MLNPGQRSCQIDPIWLRAGRLCEEAVLLHVHSVQARVCVAALALQGTLLGGHTQWLGLIVQPRHDMLEQLQIFLRAPAPDAALGSTLPRSSPGLPKSASEFREPAAYIQELACRATASPFVTSPAALEWQAESMCCPGFATFHGSEPTPPPWLFVHAHSVNAGQVCACRSSQPCAYQPRQTCTQPARAAPSLAAKRMRRLMLLVRLSRALTTLQQ